MSWLYTINLNLMAPALLRSITQAKWVNYLLIEKVCVYNMAASTLEVL